ncbi:MAG: hypothetical protein EOO88_55690, partial [Pedobacter sp.]
MNPAYRFGFTNKVATFAPSEKKTTYMLKLRLLLPALGLGIFTHAQVPVTDTLPKTDTTLQEIQESVLDNLPTISLDENDLG